MFCIFSFVIGFQSISIHCLLFFQLGLLYLHSCLGCFGIPLCQDHIRSSAPIFYFLLSVGHNLGDEGYCITESVMGWLLTS